MKDGWQSSTLGDVLEVLRNGVNCKQNKSGNGDRISRIESISDARFDLERVGFAELSQRDKTRYRLQKGDILFSHINSAIHVGKTAVFESDEPVYHGVNLLLMRPKDTVLPAFLEHALKFLFVSGYWRGVCKQSVNQASVNQQDISRVEFRYPKSLPEQRRIVGILDEAFAGIATAKANAEKNLHNARALFESHLNAVFSQRGEGWVELPLGEMATFRNGINFTKSSSGFTIRARFNRKDVVPKYVCRFLKSHTARRKMIDSGIGTNIKSLNQSTLSALVVPLPPAADQTRIAQQLNAMEDETQRLESIYQRKLVALATLKKSLLHQAFTGTL